MEVKLFGILAEHAGKDVIHVDARSTNELVKKLQDQIKGLDELNYAITVQRRIVQGDQQLQGNEEVALLPPFAGG